MNNIKINGYKNLWSEIASLKLNKDVYYLMENNTYGDETFYLIIDKNKKVICETYDDLITSLRDNDIIKF